MRAVVPFVSLAVVMGGFGPAQAQTMQQQMDAQLRASELRAQQNLLERQTVILQNQLNALDARVRTEQAISDLRAQSQVAPLPPAPERGPPRQIDSAGLASIPDQALEASNERVRAAAENRR